MKALFELKSTILISVLFSSYTNSHFLNVRRIILIFPGIQKSTSVLYECSNKSINCIFRVSPCSH